MLREKELADAMWNCARRDRYNRLKAGCTGRVIGRAVYTDWCGLRHSWAFVENPPPVEGQPRSRQQEVGVVHVRWLIRPLRIEVQTGTRWSYWRLLRAAILIPLVFVRRL